MNKRIKLLFGIFILFLCFNYQNVNAISLSCDGKDYQCRVCEYTSGNKTLELRVYSNGKDVYQIASPDVKRNNFTNLDPSTNVIELADFKNGYEIICPKELKMYLYNRIDDRPGSTLYHYYITTGSCDGVKSVAASGCSLGYTLTLTNEVTNGKPFFDEEAEKIVNEDDEKYKDGFNAPIYLDNELISETIFVKSKGQIISQEIKEHNINGEKYTITMPIANYVTSATAISSIRLNCFSQIHYCYFQDDVKKEKEGENEYNEYLSPGIAFDPITPEANCDVMLDKDTKTLIINIFNWIRIITPILLIIMASLDLSKAVLASDDKMMAMTIRNFVARCVVAVLIFFVPVIVYHVMDIALTESGYIDDAGNICRFLN